MEFLLVLFIIWCNLEFLRIILSSWLLFQSLFYSNGFCPSQSLNVSCQDNPGLSFIQPSGHPLFLYFDFQHQLTICRIYPPWKSSLLWPLWHHILQIFKNSSHQELSFYVLWCSFLFTWLSNVVVSLGPFFLSSYILP